jgi:hypothetical protein
MGITTPAPDKSYDGKLSRIPSSVDFGSVDASREWKTTLAKWTSFACAMLNWYCPVNDHDDNG